MVQKQTVADHALGPGRVAGQGVALPGEEGKPVAPGFQFANMRLGFSPGACQQEIHLPPSVRIRAVICATCLRISASLSQK